jgi:hypothetical protein
MTVRDLLASHLPMAVVAGVVLAAVDLAGGASDPTALLAEFLLHVVAVFVGFVAVDALWTAAVGDGGV